MRPVGLTAAFLVAASTMTAPVSAAPVATEPETALVQSESIRLSSIGRGLLRAESGYLVLSEADRGLTSVNFISPDINAETTPLEIVVLGAVAAQGNRVATIDSAGLAAVEEGLIDDPQAAVVRLFRSPGVELETFEEVGAAVLPTDIRENVRRFGTEIAIGGNAIAVVSETTAQDDRVDIFRVSPDGTIEWSQELLPGTLDTSVAVSTSGATIALSGVNRLAASGEVIINRIGPSGWVPIQRFLRIGGGPVHMQNERVLVQRNSFFARPSGSWTVIDSLPGRPYEVRTELPVEGSTIDARGSVVAVGDPEQDLVYLLEEVAGELRFSQAIRPPRRGALDASPRFGESVALLSGGALLVGAPGPGPSSPAGEVVRFTLADGPVGCTVVGTDGDDSLTAVVGPVRQSVCGLAGNDQISGASATDVLAGGPGNDTIIGSAEGGTIDGGPGTDNCSQAGPATAPIQITNCEEG